MSETLCRIYRPDFQNLQFKLSHWYDNLSLADVDLICKFSTLSFDCSF